MRKFSGTKYLVTLILTCTVLWAIFSWPLPAHITKGIPSSDHNLEKDHVRMMIPGDHLQLMYHFWLAADMIIGKTPLFTNLYEFNSGQDPSTMRHFDPYYAPFSIVFALVQYALPRAFAWNFAQYLALLCTFLASYLLVKRLTADRFAAMAGALLATAFPYRWITLLTGSPTGFGMCFIPLTALGIHMAVQDRKWQGGLLAGLSVFMSYCSDLHVFYFNTLSLPFWTVSFAILNKDLRITNPSSLIKPAIALLPAAILTLAAAATGIITGARLKDTDMGGGREIWELVKYSPRSRGLFSWENLGMSNHVFLGHIAVLLMLISLFAILYVAVKKKQQIRPAIFYAVLFVASLCIISLALGTNGIGDGVMIRAARKLIPKYTMIRQSVKIYCLLPVLIAILTGLGITAARCFWSKKTVYSVFTLLTLLCVIEWRMQISPSICLIKHSEPAYEAVSIDAGKQDKEPHTVIVPLWPGDSHWTSVYEHYISLYRIKMLNGYSPAIGNAYMQDVFHPLESINLGVITEKQIRLLKSMGIDYLIFHEDAFPEQVSPYPASQTLYRLLSHNHLELMKQSQSIWAFRLLDSPVQNRENPISHPGYYTSTRGWEAERAFANSGRIVEDPAASGSAIILTEPVVRLESRFAPAAPDQNISIRCKGQGSFSWKIFADDTEAGSGTVSMQSEDWTWHKMPFTTASQNFPVALEISEPEGELLLDVLFLAAGKEVSPEPGEEVTIPAAAFFRSGYTDIENKDALFRKDYDHNLQIFYALFPLIKKGSYELILDYEIDKGLSPGRLIVGPHARPVIETGIDGASPFVFRYDHWQNVPVRIGLEYSRTADLRIRSLTIRNITQVKNPVAETP